MHMIMCALVHDSGEHLCMQWLPNLLSLSFKIWSGCVAEHLKHVCCSSYSGFVISLQDLLQDIWLPSGARIFISSSEHPKQAKIGRSALYHQHTQFQPVTWKKTIQVTDFDSVLHAPRLSTRKHTFGACALRARTYSGSEQVSDAWLHNNIL